MGKKCHQVEGSEVLFRTRESKTAEKKYLGLCFEAEGRRNVGGREREMERKGLGISEGRDSMLRRA